MLDLKINIYHSKLLSMQTNFTREEVENHRSICKNIAHNLRNMILDAIDRKWKDLVIKEYMDKFPASWFDIPIGHVSYSKEMDNISLVIYNVDAPSKMMLAMPWVPLELWNVLHAPYEWYEQFAKEVKDEMYEYEIIRMFLMNSLY